jgi:hypothetical protein
VPGKQRNDSFLAPQARAQRSEALKSSSSRQSLTSCLHKHRVKTERESFLSFQVP